MSKKKIMDMVLLAASVLLAVVKTICEQEKTQEDNDEHHKYQHRASCVEALCFLRGQ